MSQLNNDSLNVTTNELYPNMLQLNDCADPGVGRLWSHKRSLHFLMRCDAFQRESALHGHRMGLCIDDVV